MFNVSIQGQISNYVTNGSFEDYWSCTYPNDILLPKGWRTIDSVTDGSRYNSTCPGIQNIPADGGGWQYPRTGNAFIVFSPYCLNGGCNSEYNRNYARNRLKAKLHASTVYCVKFFVNIRNISKCGIDAIGAYFGDNLSLDTILKANIPLTYFTPQIENPTGNVITDTTNWVQVTGTFVASGNESNMVIGNFKSSANTNTVVINTVGTIIETDMLLDDVSCIPLDLPAYAAPGPDIWAIPGNTVYLGRPGDVGIDEACMWYKLPNTTNAIDTAAGITITVAVTTETYMVKQDICGIIKYDTVVVHASALGLSETDINSKDLIIIPNPDNDEIIIYSAAESETLEIKIIDQKGTTLEKTELTTYEYRGREQISLEKGLYFLIIANKSRGNYITKKLLIE